MTQNEMMQEISLKIQKARFYSTLGIVLASAAFTMSLMALAIKLVMLWNCP